MIMTYADKKSFAKMMDTILAGLGLSPDARLIAIAHAGVETAMGTTGSSRPRTSFNFWNITAGSQWFGLTSAGKDTEYGRSITQAWRVYTSPEEAASDYLHFLSATDRKMIKQPDGSSARADVSYADALERLMNGDAMGFAYTLHDAGYYTADPTDYYKMIEGQLNAARGYLAS